MTSTFKTNFDRYACEGDTITGQANGFDFTARILRDAYAGAPDKECEGFWPSLNPLDAGYIGAKTKRTLARHMAQAEEVMRAWREDEWCYVGVGVIVSKAGVELTSEFGNALWGVECNYPAKRNRHPNAYLRDVANGLVADAMAEAQERIALLTACEVNSQAKL